MNDPVVVRLRKENDTAKRTMRFGGCLSVFQPPLGALLYGHALWTFRNQVRNGARWDFKDEIGLKLGPGVTLCASGACFNDIEYSIPGNVFFAYIGRAAGFSGIELQQGAAWAEWRDPSHEKGSEEYVDPYQGTFPLPIPGRTWWDPSTWNWGDEPKDHEAVTLGVKLWSKYKDRLTRSQFETELANYIGVLDRHVPLTKSVVSAVARDWPYPVGYFNNQGNVFNPNQEVP